MGDTHHDPVDHLRTTQPRAGMAVKNNFFWPGFILLLVALLGMVSTVLVAAYEHYDWIETTVLIAVLGVIAGALWFVVELRRVAGLETLFRLRQTESQTEPEQQGQPEREPQQQS